MKYVSLFSCTSQICPHVDTTVAITWAAAPAIALVNTMEPVVLITTVSFMSSSAEKPLLTVITNLTEKQHIFHSDALLKQIDYSKRRQKAFDLI